MTEHQREFSPANEYDVRRLPFAKRLEDLLPGDCIWPINSGGPYLFCAAKAVGKYCPHHKTRLIQKRGSGHAHE
ncbi:GcrA cell cycle regulator [Sinorhizobium americanum]|nr:GcrA cell cycle regulator [Sinorhizobium sp. NG07B]POH29260.1 GcrA cell cycle regulator [Sinorhizobium americanum]